MDNTTKRINMINKLTRQLNNINLSDDIKFSKRKHRNKLIEIVIKNKNFDKNKKCFLVPLIVPDFYISYNVAIVGNSINLTKNKLGKHIDEYNDVIRFNYAPIHGFEKYCGSKNNIRVCSYIALTGKKPKNHPIISNMIYRLDNELNNSDIIVFYKKKHHLKIIENSKQKFLNKNNNIYLLLWNPIFFNDVLKYNNINTLEKHPQCGTGLILMIADIGIKPSIYGVDTKYCNDNYYYYWDINNKKCNKLSTFHNYNDEFRIPLELNKIKMINF